MEVIKKIHQVQTSLAKSGITKDQTNTYDKYKFRGIDDVYGALSQALSTAGLVIVPDVMASEIRTIQTSGGKPSNHCKVHVKYHCYADDGSTIAFNFHGEAMDRGDKSLNKALTAAYKYMAFELFCIPVEGQDDADSESHQVAEPAISFEQQKELLGMCMQGNIPVEGFVTWLGCDSIETLPVSQFPRAKAALEKKLEALSKQYAQEQNLTHASEQAEVQ